MATLTGQDFILSKQDNAVLEIEGLEEVSFFITEFSIPALTTGTTPIPNPFLDFNAPGSKLAYEPYDITMLLAENLANWRALRDWLLEGNSGVTFNTSDITRRTGTILLTSNNGNPIFTVTLKNMFPVSISEIIFDLQQAEPVPPTFTANFSFESYTLEVAS